MRNSQLLDLLLEVNANAKIPSQLRYDLRSPTPNASDVPGLEPDIAPTENHKVDSARAAVRELKSELEANEISLQEYKDRETTLMKIIDASHESDKIQSLAKLSRISHTKLSSVPESGMPEELVDESPVSYLSPTHEDEYLSALDNYLAIAPLDAQPLLPRPLRPTEKEREKDAQINNPVSVYNWLRAHSDNKPVPHDLDKDLAPSNPNASEPSNHRLKPSPRPPSSTGNGNTKPSRKRASSALIPKQEPEEELLDDEGYVIGGGEVPASTKAKRKRENDDAYRPKGGSSKSRKRTKGSGGAALKKLEPEVEGEEEDV